VKGVVTADGKERDVNTRLVTAALAAAFVVLAAASSGSAQSFLDETVWSFDAGLSLPTGSAADAANLGFCLGFNGFYTLRPSLLVGARIAYNRWGADEEQWEGIWAANVDGHWSSFEIVPQVRYLINNDEMRDINFFGQGGLGIYRIASDLKIDYKNESIPSIDVEDSDFKLGIVLGGGITFGRGGRTYEVRPMYHIVFTEGDSFTYFAVTGGIAF
jgi:hypothetical protein